jgi:hypothetical protein
MGMGIVDVLRIVVLAEVFLRSRNRGASKKWKQRCSCGVETEVPQKMETEVLQKLETEVLQKIETELRVAE